ncbi:phosphotransferase family protein [Wenjunlia vitaminophila]|uniref:phosphotransferase family protein n=1 Tax=Wenjunlia vitaminophila TaxID=76728 RepID=UPI000399A142|nr:phosphotransferase [Wenjunlia vitaminophila]
MPSGTSVRERSLSSRTAHTVRIVRTGSSGALVRIVQRPDGTLVAVKTARNPRVPAIQQARARDTIAPYFGARLPEVLFAGHHHGSDTLITRCPSVTTLADAALRPGPTTQAAAIWTEVTEALCQVWLQSARPGFEPALATRKHTLRLERGRHGLHHAAHHLRIPIDGQHHIIVNGTDHGSLDRMLHRLAALRTPAIRVACHGDPQPRNILLDHAGQWHLVDWEWSGHHQDWRMMTSHLVGWWYVESLLAGTHGRITPTRSALALSYSSTPPAVLSRWTAPAVRAFRRMSRPAELEEDFGALAVHTAMLLFREIPKVIVEGRHHLFAPLLGEAARILDSAYSDRPHPLLEAFTHPQQTEGSLG